MAPNNLKAGDRVRLIAPAPVNCVPKVPRGLAVGTTYVVSRRDYSVYNLIYLVETGDEEFCDFRFEKVEETARLLVGSRVSHVGEDEDLVGLVGTLTKNDGTAGTPYLVKFDNFQHGHGAGYACWWCGGDDLVMAQEEPTVLAADGAPAATNDNPTSTQVGGTHYASMVIQPIDFILQNNIPFSEGSVIKYVSRWRSKGGVEDLKKARHFLDMLIAHEEKQAA